MTKHNAGLMNAKREKRQTYHSKSRYNGKQTVRPYQVHSPQQEVVRQFMPGKERITRGYTPQAKQVPLRTPQEEAVTQVMEQSAAQGFPLGRAAAIFLIFAAYAALNGGCGFYLTNHRHADQFIKYSAKKADGDLVTRVRSDGTKKTDEELKKEAEKRRKQMKGFWSEPDVKGKPGHSQEEEDKINQDVRRNRRHRERCRRRKKACKDFLAVSGSRDTE